MNTHKCQECVEVAFDALDMLLVFSAQYCVLVCCGVYFRGYSCVGVMSGSCVSHIGSKGFMEMSRKQLGNLCVLVFDVRRMVAAQVKVEHFNVVLRPQILRITTDQYEHHPTVCLQAILTE